MVQPLSIRAMLSKSLPQLLRREGLEVTDRPWRISVCAYAERADRPA
jgi:hypothetical protein